MSDDKLSPEELQEQVATLTRERDTYLASRESYKKLMLQAAEESNRLGVERDAALSALEGKCGVLQTRALREAKAERDAARANLRLATSTRDDVWFWQPRDNDPATLACPVVMSAETFREFDAAKAAAAEMRQGLNVAVTALKQLGASAMTLAMVEECRSSDAGKDWVSSETWREAVAQTRDSRARLEAKAAEMRRALETAQSDINWMLNNRQFLNAFVFAYIELALSSNASCELLEDADLGRKLVNRLLPFVGDGGSSEGADECLARLLEELERLRSEVAVIGQRNLQLIEAIPGEFRTRGEHVGREPLTRGDPELPEILAERKARADRAEARVKELEAELVKRVFPS